MDRIRETEEKINNILNDAYKLLRQGSFDESREFLNGALKLDFENEDIISALKSVNFWNERKRRLDGINGSLEKGNYLFEQWGVFFTYLQGCGEDCQQVLYPVKKWVFSTALTLFQTVLDKTGMHDPDLLCNLGRAYKGIGDYEHAVEYIEAANHQRIGDAEIMAELADSYACINEVRAAKIFFREAFYIDPQKIKLRFFESLFIGRLVNEVKNMGYSNDLLKEWIPIYGNIYGVLNVKRELKPLEFGKLKQAIFDYEQKIETSEEEQTILIPRLLNKYFWLIDHLIASKSDRFKIEEILAKVKELNHKIYEKYIN
jgi:tetratricopeptide (TPR) repeat protein